MGLVLTRFLFAAMIVLNGGSVMADQKSSSSLEQKIAAYRSAHPVSWKPGQPHPGKILEIEYWNGSLNEKDAASIPESIRMVNGKPVLEIHTISVDQAGKPVEPSLATRIEINQVGPGGESLKRTYANPERQKKSDCVKVWTAPDAKITQRHHTHFAKVERLTKTFDTGDGDGVRSRVLSDAEFTKFDQFLRGLCLTMVKGEPSPPPGGSTNIEILDGKVTRRLGDKGRTGGDYLLLSDSEFATLGGMISEFKKGFDSGKKK